MTTTLRSDRLFDAGLPAADSVEKLDQEARKTFARVPQDPPLATRLDSSISPEYVLTRSAQYLELWRALTGIAEAVGLIGAETVKEVRDSVGQILDRAGLLSQLNVLEVLLNDPAVRAETERPHKKLDPDEAFPLIVSPSFVRVVSSLVEFCPIRELEALGSSISKPDLGHRCRTSYDWLRAFVRRRSAGEAETLHILGRAYAEGRLSLSDAAHLLSMPRADAVAWLEECGYSRDLDVIRLSPNRRDEIASRIRRERLARNGAPVADGSRVARDVIATQRIEDIDARRWVHPGA